MQFANLICEAAEVVSDPILVFATKSGNTAAIEYAWGNAAFRKMIGSGETDFPQDALSRLIGNDQARRVLESLAVCPENQTELTFQVQICFEGDAFVPSELIVRQLSRRQADTAFWCVSFRVSSGNQDLLSNLIDARAEAALSTQRLWDAIEALPDAFVMYDATNSLIACNQRYKDFYKASAPAIFPGAKFENIMRFGVENGQNPEAMGNEEAWLTDIVQRFRGSDEPINRVLSDGRHIVIHDVHTKHGDVVGLRTDVTMLRQQESLLKAQALDLEKAKLEAETASNTDPLTGLGNRRGLQNFFADVSTLFGQELSIAALHFDLDKFKQINDQYGHGVGDQVLCQLAFSLQEGIGDDGYAARIGGDEFLAVVWAKNVQRRSEQLANFVIKQCAETRTYDDERLSFGVSIGIACADKASISDLWMNSDLALYESKRKGRGSFTLFSPELAAMTQEKRELCDAMTSAILENSVDAVFQPQVDAQSEKVIGIEALARWTHPVLGAVPPSKFLPIAEELGLLPDLDELIFRKTLSCVEKLTDLGFVMPSVSINVGEKTLFSDQFHRAVAKADRQPCTFIFELLETIDFEMDGEALTWAVEMLRQRGALIALDDFGSGRSSLTTLMDLRPDRIKIDRRISAEVHANALSEPHMMKAICEMAKAIDVGITAEGIETRLQADIARELGCDAFQGYLFAAPLSEPQLVSFVSGQVDKDPNEKLRRRA